MDSHGPALAGRGGGVVVVAMHMMMHHMMMTSALVVRHIGQGEAQFLPEEFISPLEIGVRFKIEPYIGI